MVGWATFSSFPLGRRGNDRPGLWLYGLRKLDRSRLATNLAIRSVGLHHVGRDISIRESPRLAQRETRSAILSAILHAVLRAASSSGICSYLRGSLARFDRR